MHAALLTLQRMLAEADRALLTGDERAAEVALRSIGNSLELYRLRQEEEALEHVRQSALETARKAARLKVARLLADIDASLATGDLEGVKSALEKASEVFEASRALEESTQESGIRSRFPSRLAK